MSREFFPKFTIILKMGNFFVSIAKTFDGDIDIAILDIVLSDMRGKTIYSHIREARQDLKVIVFSGYFIDGPARRFVMQELKILFKNH